MASVSAKRTIVTALLGGALFLLVFGVRLATVPSEFYEVRDDGVITLSHARNLVDFGFVGVNPSGERVEGYSAPVQFGLYAILYRVTGLSYASYATIQTWLCTFLLGALFAGFFRLRSWAGRCGVLIGAVLLSTRSAFVEWHASGLENAITHVTFLATILVLSRSLDRRRIRFGWAALPALAGLSRVDGVFHVGPLLLLFVALWFWEGRNRQAATSPGGVPSTSGALAGPGFALLALALIGAVHLARWVYFGDFVPNTGAAQGISVRDYLGLLVRFDPAYFQVTGGWAHALLRAHGGYAFLALLPGLLLLTRRSRDGMTAATEDRTSVPPAASSAGSTAPAGRTPTPVTPATVLLLATLVATAALAPFVFGKPSLDPLRTTTQMALGVALGSALLLVQGWESLRARRETKRRPRPAPLLIASVTALAAGWLLVESYARPYPLCCPAARFETVREALVGIGEREGIPRPLVATPDLGALSWHKDVNTVDLGRLGSPILARLRRGPLLRLYLFDEAAPDLIECHGAWLTHHYAQTLSHPRFQAIYERLEDSPLREFHDGIGSPADGTNDGVDNASDRTDIGTQGPPDRTNDGADANGPTAGIWIRRDVRASSPSRERRLIDAMAGAPDLSLLEAELLGCSERGGDPTYIARTAYRFLPELLTSTDLSTITELFRSHGASPFDLYLLRGRKDGRAYEAALESLIDEYLERTLGDDPKPILEDRFRIYQTAEQLLWVREGAEEFDAEGQYFVRLDTATGSGGKEFTLAEAGYRIGDRILLLLPLPSVEIHRIEVGQKYEGEVLWAGSVGTSP